MIRQAIAWPNVLAPYSTQSSQKEISWREVS